jgi:uncharacterized coiled-coil protein SlyX
LKKPSELSILECIYGAQEERLHALADEITEIQQLMEVIDCSKS